MLSNKLHSCRVCGLYIKDLPWGDNNDSPTYEICPCCGVEFGNEDCTLESIKEFRQNWIDTGAIWFAPDEKPKNWDMEEQLKEIPNGFK